MTGLSLYSHKLSPSHTPITSYKPPPFMTGLSLYSHTLSPHLLSSSYSCFVGTSLPSVEYTFPPYYTSSPSPTYVIM